MHMPRSRGAATGVLLVLLGLWGGLIPFVGPYFDFTIGPDNAWQYTTGRLWLSILPAAAVVLGGLLLIGARNRATGGFGAWLALLGGLWFVVGPTLSRLWNDGISDAGAPLGSTNLQVAEQIGYFLGLGALITALAAFALGRMAVRSARDAELEREAERERERERRERTAATGGAAATTRPAARARTTPDPARFEREREREPATTTSAAPSAAPATTTTATPPAPPAAASAPADAAPAPADAAPAERRRTGGLVGRLRRRT